MNVHATAGVMGGPAVIGAKVEGVAALRRQVAAGLDVATLQKTVAHVFSDAAEARAFLHRIVPEGTYKRRLRSGRLTAAESERTARLAGVVALAEDVLHHREAARQFLTLPHAELGDERPIDAALDDLGARQVENILMGIRYGMPA